jgi:hypothetical protein
VRVQVLDTSLIDSKYERKLGKVDIKRKDAIAAQSQLTKDLKRPAEAVRRKVSD